MNIMLSIVSEKSSKLETKVPPKKTHSLEWVFYLFKNYFLLHGSIIIDVKKSLILDNFRLST